MALWSTHSSWASEEEPYHMPKGKAEPAPALRTTSLKCEEGAFG